MIAGQELERAQTDIDTAKSPPPAPPLRPPERLPRDLPAPYADEELARVGGEPG